MMGESCWEEQERTEEKTSERREREREDGINVSLEEARERE